MKKYISLTCLFLVAALVATTFAFASKDARFKETDYRVYEGVVSDTLHDHPFVPNDDYDPINFWKIHAVFGCKPSPKPCKAYSLKHTNSTCTPPPGGTCLQYALLLRRTRPGHYQGSNTQNAKCPRTGGVTSPVTNTVTLSITRIKRGLVKGFKATSTYDSPGCGTLLTKVRGRG